MQSNITFDLIGHAQKRPDAPALLLPHRTIDFRALDQLVWQYAAALHALGVRAGQVVGLSFVEELGLVLALLALARLGATAYSIPRSATASQRRQMAEQAATAWLASDQPERFESGVASLRLQRQAIEAGPLRIDSRLMAPAPEAPWLLITGSGSTGRPKLIPVSHAQGRARSELGARALGLAPSDRVAALSHFDFSTSKFRLHEALRAGAACALELWSDAPQVMRRCASAGLTVLYGTVFHAERLIASLPAGSCHALPMLRAFELTASTISDDLRQRFRQMLTPQLYVRYGINEAGPVAVAGPPEVYQIAGTVGRPPAGVEIELVDRRGQPLPPATVGLVRIRTPALVDGYLGDEEASRTSFQDGWFLPGDLGLLTREGQLVFYGRADHMLIMNGINIYPAEIEQLMAAHPAVADVAVVPVRHRVHQDIPVCALTLRAGASVSEQALLEHAGSRLGARAPYRVLVVDAIPRNQEGKLVRAELLRLIGSRLLTPDARASQPTQKPVPGPDTGQRRQRLQRLDQSFTLPEAVDLPALDGWLARILPTPIEAVDPAAGWSQSPPSAQQQPAGQWLWRALLLARQLLQASRIPVFDPPQIVSLDGPAAEAGRWQARVALALVHQLPLAVYSEALTAALRLCELAASQALTEASLEGLYDEANRVIDRLTRLMPPGKSTLPLLQAAHDQGIPFLHLGGGIFQLGWGSKSHRIDRSATGLDSAIGARLAQSKALTARLLQGAGLPAPRQQVVTDVASALAAARRLCWPVVIKPQDLDRGEGVAVDVADEAMLQAAFATAQGLSRAGQVIVERQVAGCCHRLFIARGRLLYAVKRLPMSVLADGRHRIAELVQAELDAQRRRPPWQRSKIQPLDALALSALAAAGYSADSVPPAGQWVALRRIESTVWGGVDEEVSAIVHPENLRIALEASRLFGLDIAGIDLITPDIARPWFENGAIINEVNHAPQLGGGEISRRQIPALLDLLLQDRGRIPIEVFVGGEAAWTAASQRWQALLADGLRAYLTGPELTLEPSGAPHHMALTGSYPRASALALSARVDAIVMAVPPREFIAAELPFEGVERLVGTEALFAHAPGRSGSRH